MTKRKKYFSKNAPKAPIKVIPKTDFDVLLDLQRDFFDKSNEIIMLSEQVILKDNKGLSDIRKYDTWAKIKKEFPKAIESDFIILWDTVKRTSGSNPDKLSPKEKYDIAITYTSIYQQYGNQYYRHLLSASKPEIDVDRFIASMVVTLVSDFELFCNKLFEFVNEIDDDKIMRKHAGGDTRKYTWHQLLDFDSIDDMKKTMRRTLADDNAYNSFPQNLNIFGIELPSIFKEFDTVEIFQRRNVIVHHGGKVSTKYLQSFKNFSVELAPLDTLLITQKPYLMKVAARLKILVLILFSIVAKNYLLQFKNQFEELEKAIVILSYEFLVDENYEEALTLVSQKVLYEDMSYPRRDHFLVNGWIAHREQGTLTDVLNRIKFWNPDESDNMLPLAKEVLIYDSIKEIEEKIKLAYASGELSIGQWVSWPLFKELREKIEL